MKTILVLTFLFVATLLSSAHAHNQCQDHLSTPIDFIWNSEFMTSPAVSSQAYKISLKTRDNVCIQGIRLKNEGKKPVLLIHGFMENLTIFNSIAQELHHNGHDVYLFNMRGHGNGLTSSYAIDEFSYMGFDEIVAYDIPKMIDYIFQTTNKKMTIIGHSMGTMSSRLSVSGMTKSLNEDDLSYSEKIMKWSLKRVSSMIALTSPSSFKNSDEIVKNFFKLETEGLKDIRQDLLNILFYQRDASRNKGSIFWKYFNRYTNWVTEGLIRFGIPRYYVSTLFKLDNFDFETFELSTLIHDSMSVPDDDLFEDASRWVLSNRYASRQGNILFENYPIPSAVPYYFIGADEDGLANIADISNDFLSQKNHPNTAYILVKGFGHMDIVASSKGKKRVTRILNNILENNFNKKALSILNIYPDISVEL